jgi:uncharacterized protein (TIGR03437 family)
VDVTVILNPGAPNEIRSTAGKVQVATYSPGLFQMDSKHILAINASNQNALVSADHPAKPGDMLTFFGTGFGGSTPTLAPGEFPAGPMPLLNPVTINIGGVILALADVPFAGLTPAAPGLCQFNVRLPSSLPDGDVPVKIRIGAVETQDAALVTVRR